VRSKKVIEVLEESGKALKNAMNFVAVISFLLLLLISTSLDKYWSLMNVMQIFVFISLYDTSLTVPLAIFFKYLIKIVTFEIVEMGDYFTEWFEYEDEEAMSKRFEVLSFERKSFLVTLGFMIVVLVSILLSYLIVGLLHPCRKHLPHFLKKKVYKRLKKDIFWSAPLVFIIEGYLDICLGIVMYYHSEAGYEKSGDIIDFYMASFFTVGVIVVPIAGVFFLCANRKQIREIENSDSDESSNSSEEKKDPNHERKKQRKKCIKRLEDYYDGLDHDNGAAVVTGKFIYLFRRGMVILLLFWRLSSNSCIPLLILLYI